MTQTGYSEQDVMAEMLSTLKQLKAEMNLLTQEAGTPALYTKAKKMYDHISTLQRDVYDVMVEQAFYQVSGEKKPAISRLYTKFSNKEEQL